MSWRKTLSQSGYRISKPRLVVMEILAQAKIPMTPLAIFKQSQKAGRKIGLVSVYRALELLTRLGLVCLVYANDGSQGYTVTSEGHHHHIICRVCEQAIEFSGVNDLEELILRVQQETGYTVSDHFLQLFGVCPNCQKLL